MSMPSLADSDSLKESCAGVIDTAKQYGNYQVWRDELTGFLSWFRSATEDERSTE